MKVVASLAAIGWFLLLAIRTERLALGPQTLTINIEAPVLSKEVVLPYADIDAIEMPTAHLWNGAAAKSTSTSEADSDTLQKRRRPTILAGGRKVSFAGGASEAEQEWIVSLIKTAVYEHTGRIV